jgi:apolipoprotein N-acyltransferase
VWLLGGYAVATFFSFPHPIAGHVVDLGLLLAWFGPALLLLGVDGLAPLRAMCLAFAAALVANAGIVHWAYVVTVTYGHAPAIAGVAGSIGLGSYVALFTALFAGGAAWLARRRADSPFVLAALWTVGDHLRSFALSGFPWATLGYAQHANPPLLALAPFTGVYGLSFVTVLGGAALAAALRARRLGRAPGPSPLFAFAVVLAIHAAGALVSGGDDESEAGRVRLAVLQGNIDQGVKWSPEWAVRTLDIYEELTRRAAARGARLILWPETAVPGSIDTDTALRQRLSELARETGAGLVLGGVGVDRDPRDGAVRYYDSAYLIDPEGTFTGRYDKAHLVPFGEYVPLRPLLGLFLKGVARGIASNDVTAGAAPRAVALPVDGPHGRAVSGGVPICYELLFPDLVRRFVGDGAELLLAITNDAWYGRTGAPYQFLAMTALRSAETRVWTARAANTGVSAIIDARGRVRAQTRIFERDLLVADVPLRPAPLGGSFYTRHGDVFAAACWLAVVAGGCAAWFRSRRGALPD